MMKNLLALLSIFTLFSCASSTEKITYYSFNLNSIVQPLEVTPPASKKKSLIIIEPIVLASFLRQQGLIIQAGNYEIITANYHRWAEPLEDAIPKLLLQQLNNNNDNYHFEQSNALWKQNSVFNLSLELDKFQATDDSTISVSGRYQLYGKDKQLNLSKEFVMTDNLTQDGYKHTVEKLQQAVRKLAEKISHSINNSLVVSTSMNSNQD